MYQSEKIYTEVMQLLKLLHILGYRDKINKMYVAENDFSPI